MRMHSHRAPEQTDAEFGARGPHTDVWGFGTTLLHLATGQQPYKDLTLVQMVTAMTKARPPAVPHTLPAWLQHILQQSFSFDVSKRPRVQQLLQVKPLSVWLAVSSAAMQPIAVVTSFMQLAADWKLGKLLSLQMAIWEIVVLSAGNFARLLCKRTLRHTVQLEWLVHMLHKKDLLHQDSSHCFSMTH